MRNLILVAAGLILLYSCSSRTEPVADYFGTLEPFAAENVYFIVTDRFVDGDQGNNYPEQGGTERGSFDVPVQLPDMAPGNIGYLGGDFKGVLDNAEYITDMGFTAVWLTPVVDNPDEAFTGGIRPGEGFGADKGKTGYHGYWGVNFFAVDEHLVSPGLGFSELTQALADDHDLKFVLDVVCNHGSPSYSMEIDQPKYGELYDGSGTLVADHQNLQPQDLDPENPLHQFYHREPDLAQLSNMNDLNPAVLDYFVDAYTFWLDQGVAAFRIDTVKHMPHAYWQQFAERMRAVRPDLFMFAESYSFDAEQIAQHTWPENGGISVLDFPGKQAMNEVFAAGAPYARLLDYLHLKSRVYQNVYELMTFYDNHDMPRMDADENGFIDAHNWLFTSRGIPVVYYGSEVGFMRGAPEHGGNRDYFGQENIDGAAGSTIHTSLARIAEARKNNIALQRGLHLSLEHISDDTVAFYRVFQHDGVQQTALVLLNKGDAIAVVDASNWIFDAEWQDALGGAATVARADASELKVPAHGVRVLVTGSAFRNAPYEAELADLQKNARRN